MLELVNTPAKQITCSRAQALKSQLGEKTCELKSDQRWKEPKTQRAGFASQLTALPVADKQATESVSHSHFYLGC